MTNSSQGSFSAEQLAVAQKLHEHATRQKVRLFLVGGAVRDLMRGLSFHDQDLDLLVEGDAIAFASQVAADLGGTLKKFPDFITAKLVAPTGAPAIAEIDFASTRAEVYAQPGALPKVTIATVEEDLSRRDFSINAMALELSKLLELCDKGYDSAALSSVVIDKFSGKQDLARGLVRVLHDRSFVDDPTRLFRACRYVARIEGGLETHTQKLFQAAVISGAISTLSRFRIATEIRKMAEEALPAAAFTVAISNELIACCDLVPTKHLKAFYDFLTGAAFSKQHSIAVRISDLLRTIASYAEDATHAERALLSFGLSKKRIREVLEDRGK